jgi:hypothetical protein
MNSVDVSENAVEMVNLYLLEIENFGLETFAHFSVFFDPA